MEKRASLEGRIKIVYFVKIFNRDIHSGRYFALYAKAASSAIVGAAVFHASGGIAEIIVAVAAGAGQFVFKIQINSSF